MTGYDPKNAEIMVNNIYLGLVKVDPSDQAYFEKNRDNYEAQLEALDELYYTNPQR